MISVECDCVTDLFREVEQSTVWVDVVHAGDQLHSVIQDGRCIIQQSPHAASVHFTQVLHTRQNTQVMSNYSLVQLMYI